MAKSKSVYVFEYALDAYIDGRMAEETQLFSTLENALEYVRKEYPNVTLEKEDDGSYFYSREDEWDDESFSIRKIELDSALNRR